MNFNSEVTGSPTAPFASDAALSDSNALAAQQNSFEGTFSSGDGELSPSPTVDHLTAVPSNVAEAAKSIDLANPLKDLCVDLEAFETPRWALEALLEVEICTPTIIDPCSGTGIIARVCIERGHKVFAVDIHDWSRSLPEGAMHTAGIRIVDFLTDDAFGECVKDRTIVMNPPFSLACQFVDRALALGARKVITFQRQAWRESTGRREWWQSNRPSRVWVCGARATCWRFDMVDCQHADGKKACGNYKSKLGRQEDFACQHCSAGSSVAMAWYVFERGHTGAEITNAIYPVAA